METENPILIGAFPLACRYLLTSLFLRLAGEMIADRYLVGDTDVIIASGIGL